MKGFIYKITNPNNKSYIGQTNNIIKRISKYRRLSCFGQPIIYNSLLKYGFENHKIEILFSSEETDIDTLNNLEEFFIRENKTLYPLGMNIMKGGNNKECSSITIEKLRKSHIEKRQKPETIEKIRMASTGKIKSKETRDKISKAHKGKPKSIEHRKKLSEARKNYYKKIK